jgi:hypothetical protein
VIIKASWLSDQSRELVVLCCLQTLAATPPGLELSHKAVFAGGPLFEVIIQDKCSPSGVARTTSGPVGVFKVFPNDKLAPVRESEKKIRKDFKDVYGNSLDRLRKHLKNK